MRIFRRDRSIQLSEFYDVDRLLARILFMIVGEDWTVFQRQSYFNYPSTERRLFPPAPVIHRGVFLVLHRISNFLSRSFQSRKLHTLFEAMQFPKV